MDNRFATQKPLSMTIHRLWEKRWIRWVLGLVLGGIALGGITLILLAAWVSKDLPDPNTLYNRQIAQSTKIYDRTGTVLLYEVHGDEKRTLVPIDQIPTILRQATVSIEDRKFYEHHGVDWVGLFRAVVRNALQGQGPKGTSTLTQQLVRNAIITNERSYTRKLKEMILSLQIERNYSKDQILQMYLNEVPYGSTLYGVESASQSYFGKSVHNLTLDEAAMIASIPQAPDRLSPYGTGVRGDNRPQLVQRQHLVLDKMAEQGFITKDQAKEAKDIDTLAKLQPQQVQDIKAPHFVMYIRGILNETFAVQGGLKYVEQSGLKVITTLDWDKQQVAEKTIKAWVDKNGKKYQFNNASLISLDPKTGQIVSMVGSADFFNKAIDGQVNVTLSARQPGSSFKPIVYATAFSKGYLPETEVYDALTTFKTGGADYQPHNYSLKENGPVTLRKALQGSLNIPAVKVLYLAGLGSVLDFADQLGYTTLKDRSRFGLSLVLGGGEVTPLEHAHAYAAFANDGMQMPVAPILKVESSEGETLSEWKSTEGARVIDQQVARTLSDVLTDNSARAYIFGTKNSLTLPDRPVAAKTGTTNGYNDAWTIGYTPNAVTVVWVGNTKNTPMKQGADGSIVAAPIWQTYMKEATKKLPVEAFIKPDAPSTRNPALLGGAIARSAKIDKFTGLLATDATPPEQTETRIYLAPHDILYFVDKDNPMGDAPTNPANDPQFSAWESGAQNWIDRAHATTTAQMPTVSSDQLRPEFTPTIMISEPTSYSAITSRFVPIQIETSSPRNATLSIQIQLGTIDLGTVQGPPWNFGITIPEGTADGSYNLVFTVKDEAGNKASQTVPVIINLTGSLNTGGGIPLELIEPTSTLTF